jgi:putative transposase
MEPSRDWYDILPRCRRQAVYGQLRRELGTVFRLLGQEKESEIIEGLPDQVHMLLLVSPRYAVAQVVGYIKGKSAINIARVYAERRRNFVGQHFSARGYWVSTGGRDEACVRRYSQEQENEDKRGAGQDMDKRVKNRRGRRGLGGGRRGNSRGD